MADTHSPETEPTPAPGIGRVEIPIPPELFEVDDDVVMDDPDLLGIVLSDAEDAKLHLGAVLEVLHSVPATYKIEAGLYTGNLDTIYARLQRLIEGLYVLVDGQVEGGAA